jgi:hypothetical protein
MTLKCRSSDTSNLDMPKEAGKLRHESSSLHKERKKLYAEVAKLCCKNKSTQ